ncbi:RNA pseudouridine synthase [candidate division WOR-3 bacterium]|uniref:Pseudouridine synthase n=1 Tax=candidate division WOR-3 bacterium TaxID=2052148 RepID=A0A660SHP2_UNCW3|nr:MAG: RNA pseudouridine synthase [candidate division WOR-3 bacterium]
MPFREFRRIVSQKMDGLRLDHYLIKSGVGVTRSTLKRLIQEGLVLVNGRKVRPSHKIRVGDVIEARYEVKPPLNIRPQPIPIKIVYEDAHIIVVDKDKGVVVHPARGHPDHTLVNALLYHCGELPSGSDKLRPGVVHRLDKDTTGLIVFAKTDEALSRLGIMVEKRRLERRYFALVWGDFPTDQFEIDAPIGRDTINRMKMAVTPIGSKTAQTVVRVKERFGIATALEVILKTGRTHQIRTHLEHLGFPVVGDPEYGGRDPKVIKDRRGYEIYKEVLELIDRQALHASYLGFSHPITKRKMEFHSELPSDIRLVLQLLRKGVK